MVVTATTVVAWGDGCGGRWERHCHWDWNDGGTSSMLKAGVVASGEVCWAVHVIVRYVKGWQTTPFRGVGGVQTIASVGRPSPRIRTAYGTHSGALEGG